MLYLCNILKGVLSMIFDTKKIALNIKQLCKERKIPIKTALEECSLNRNFIYDLENRGSIPSIETFYKLATYFNCSIEYLLGKTDNVDSQEIAHARNATKKLYEMYDTPIKDIEDTFGVNYGTFRSWYSGYGDFFNSIDRLCKLANMFNISLDELLGRSFNSIKSNSAKSQKYAVPTHASDERLVAESRLSVPPIIEDESHTS